MTQRATGAALGAIVLASALVGVWALTRVPPGQLVATHFDATGRANGWSPAPIAMFIMPAMAALMVGLWFVLPRVTPRGDNLRRSGGAYGVIFIAATLMLGLGQAVIIASALGRPIAIAGATPAAVGLLFIAIGNVLPKLRWNYVVGIRTPWTLADERVWDRTHRFGGWVMVLGGLVILVGAVIPPFGAKPGLLGVVGGGVALLTVLYSYLAWRDLRKQDAR
jgi:uncharacterized membrane protein